MNTWIFKLDANNASIETRIVNQIELIYENTQNSPLIFISNNQKIQVQV